MYLFQYYEEMGKPTPKAEVMRFLKSKQYTDAKDFAGECESVVMIAKGQSSKLPLIFLFELGFTFLILFSRNRKLETKNTFDSSFRFQNAGVQGTCKYGTRVDYILASSDSPYKFVPGSYSVFSSKGTSDHHIVKVDITKVESGVEQYVDRKPKQRKQRIVKITNSSSTKGIWKTDSGR